MADLYNLLEELDERQDEDVKGRESLETAATEQMMSEDWDDAEQVDVPAALQDASQGFSEKQNTLDNEEGGALQEENEAYQRLQRNWLQERTCPELLQYDEELVEDYKTKFEDHQDWIDQLETSGESVDALLGTIAQVDLDRTKFVLSDWLTARLVKIEAHPLHIREKVDHMSEAEVAYLKQYGALLEHHLRQTVLDHVPEAWQALDEPHMIEKPNLDEYHFWMVNEAFDDDDTEPGACLVAKYKDMAEPMQKGKVEMLL
jgi:GINS complex subunit 4